MSILLALLVAYAIGGVPFSYIAGKLANQQRDMTIDLNRLEGVLRKFL